MNSQKMNRRQFIRKTTGLALGAVSFPFIVPSSALGADGTVAPSNRITMGCIGLGGQGTHNMRSFMRLPGVQVVALCDIEKRKNYPKGGMAGLVNAEEIVKGHYAGQTSAGTYKGLKSYADFRDLVARDDIDAVTVCTPDHWHALISIAAATTGKDIYCEKPLANTIVEGRAVCDAVKRYGRVLQTGSHERSRANARFACELVRNGRIGKLHTIVVNMPAGQAHHQEVIREDKPQPLTEAPKSLDYDMWLGHTPWKPYTPYRSHFWWRFILDYGGGEMTDRGAHIIDLGQLGNGTDDTGPVELSAEGLALKKGVFNAFMKFNFECKYANGVILKGQSSGRRGVKFEGTEGWIFIQVHGGSLYSEPLSLLEESIGPKEIHLGRSPAHHENFIDSVKTRKPPVAPAEVGHRTGSICHLLNIAMLTGKKLKWDPATEVITNDAEANRMLSRPMRSPWHL